MSAKWLLAYDFSKEAARIIDKIAAELDGLKGYLVLVHVNNLPLRSSSFSVVASDTTFNNAQEFSTAVNERVEEQLRVVKKDLLSRYPNLGIEIVIREGDVVEEILGVCKEKDVDRLVVSTHSRRGVGRMLMGSIAERIVRLSPVSVLVVKIKDE